ncbi:MAG: hypothetical protein CMH83_19560 [Nocardioides sp.]|nr:hypothetical protein [Nocardioides sp.]
MKAISVRQPWAGAILTLGKDVENRSRTLGSYRGTVAVHASQNPAPATAVATVEKITGAPVPFYGAPSAGIAWDFGAIIGVVDLVDVHTYRDCADHHGAPCSPWAERSGVHLQLARPRVLARPVPARGQLGLWTVDDITADIVQRYVR